MWFLAFFTSYVWQTHSTGQWPLEKFLTVCDILLDSNQFCSALQQHSLPSAPETLILFETCKVPMFAILPVVEAIPTVLVKWRLSENMCSNVPIICSTVCECLCMWEVYWLYADHLQELKAYILPKLLQRHYQRQANAHVSPHSVFSDMSGNKNKKWYIFNNWCLLVAGLPRHLNSQASNIHLISFYNCVSTCVYFGNGSTHCRQTNYISRLCGWRFLMLILIGECMSLLHFCCAHVLIQGVSLQKVCERSFCLHKIRYIITTNI